MARSARTARNIVIGVLALGSLSFIAAPLAAQQEATPAGRPTEHQPGQPAGRQPAQPGQAGQPGERRGQPGPRMGGAQNVEGAMKMMNRALRNLSRSIDKAEAKEENLKSIAEAQAACATARTFKPEAAEGDAGKIADFRKRLIGLSHTLLDIEEMILDGKNSEAKAAFDKIKEMQEEGHKALGVKQD